MTRRNEMLAEHQTSFFHDSTFVDRPDGRLLHASGKRFCTSDDGGITWSPVFECKDRDGNPVGGGGTSLVKLSGNGIGLAAMRKGMGVNHPDWMEQYTYMVFWRSDDGGKTWERPVRMTRPGAACHALQDVALRTSSGRIIVPVYVHKWHTAHPADPKPPMTGKLVFNQWYGTSGHFYDPASSNCQVHYSDDDGRTWKVNHDGELMIQIDWGGWTAGGGEPTVAEVSPGKIIMLIRTRLGRLYQAWSYDNGETWTAPFATSLAASTTPAQIRRIPSTGHLLVVWNQEGHDDVHNGFNRMRMSSAISRNGGSVWEFYQNIMSIDETVRVEPGPIEHLRPLETYHEPGKGSDVRDPSAVKTAGFHGRWSYPSLYVGKDRAIVTHTYTHLEEHATKAQLVRVGGAGNEFNQYMKVLPLTWFYGGKQPADSDRLPRQDETPTP